MFTRASMFGGAIQPSLFEVRENDVDFIGILSAGKKAAYSVPPGKHTFMVVSEAAGFMEANVEGGKTYYAQQVQPTNHLTCVAKCHEDGGNGHVRNIATGIKLRHACQRAVLSQ